MHAVACIMTSIETRMCLSSEYHRGNHLQRRIPFVSVSVEGNEVTVCLSRLRWQLERGRSASGMLNERAARNGGFSCFERSVGNTAQIVRCASSSRSAVLQGRPASLHGAHVFVRSKLPFPSLNGVSAEGKAPQFWKAFLHAVAGSAQCAVRKTVQGLQALGNGRVRILRWHNGWAARLASPLVC